MSAMMFPSVSLNHAALAPPPVAMPFTVLSPGRVVLFKDNTAPAQVRDLGLHVRDLPECLARARCAGAA